MMIGLIIVSILFTFGCTKPVSFEDSIAECKVMPESNFNELFSKVTCFEVVSYKIAEISDCDSLDSIQESNYCKMGVAERKLDSSICDNLEGMFAPNLEEPFEPVSYRDMCIAAVAIVSLDESKCDLITDVPYKEGCKLDVQDAKK